MLSDTNDTFYDKDGKKVLLSELPVAQQVEIALLRVELDEAELALGIQRWWLRHKGILPEE